MNFMQVKDNTDKNNFKSQTFSPIKKNNLSPSGVVIYGAGYAGKQILSELRKDNQEVLCFVDDNIKLQNLMIHEIPVLSYSGLLKLKTYAKIKRVYLTIPSLNKNSQNTHSHLHTGMGNDSGKAFDFNGNIICVCSLGCFSSWICGFGGVFDLIILINTHLA